MENHSKILVLIIILVILIILVTVGLLLLRKETIIQEDNPMTTAFQDTEKLENRSLFFQIDSHIKEYISYVMINKQAQINSISPNKPVTVNNTNYTTFTSKEMYTIDKISNITVFVYGLARNQKTEDKCYLIINIDYSNNAYEIKASSETEFESAKNNLVNEEYKQSIKIEKNKYNAFSHKQITDLQIMKIYFDDYKFKAINKPEEAYFSLDADYRKQKFDDNINAYKQYIKDNINQLQDANIVKHGVTTLENGNKEYVFIDNFENYYKFIETGINEYIVILDNYTIQTDEQIQKYNKLTSQEKAVSNVDKVMKLINEKSYSTVYNYLNNEFKNMYFPTLERFINYIKQNFFENNIVGQITVGNQGDNYIVTVPYKEFLSSAAEEREAVFIVKLKEGTNFELSINMN